MIGNNYARVCVREAWVFFVEWEMALRLSEFSNFRLVGLDEGMDRG